MSDTILGGDITLHYFDDNRRKQMIWTGAATDTATMNAYFSAVGTLFDASPQGDDATPFKADTPDEYKVGLIDANDSDPWYVGYELMQHITNGSLFTVGWTRTTGTATGIVVVPVTSNTITSGSVGLDITHDVDSDAGTLLEVIEQGATDYLVIRPDSSAAANDWNSTSGGITCNAQTATQAAASTTGEQVWANLFNILPVDDDTHWYLYQGAVDGAVRARVEDINDATQDWWAEGDFDRVVPTRDYKTDTNPIIDGGFITVFARKGNTLYDSFEVSTSTTSGGRNPVALKPAIDGNNTTGYRSVTTTAVAVDDFAVGYKIIGQTSGAEGIITQIDGSSPTYTFHYYLIGDPQTDFQTAAEGVDVDVADGTGESDKNGSAPASQGPELSTWFTSNTAPTIAFGASNLI